MSEDFRKELEKLKDKVINFNPPPKTRQTRHYPKNRGNFLGNTFNGLGNRRKTTK